MQSVTYRKGMKDADNHEAFYLEVGKRIRKARERRRPKLTQDGLARLVGLTRTSITNVEKGRQKCLLHTLAEIARVLCVEPATLFPLYEAPATELEASIKNRSVEEKDWIRKTTEKASLK